MSNSIRYGLATPLSTATRCEEKVQLTRKSVTEWARKVSIYIEDHLQNKNAEET